MCGPKSALVTCSTAWTPGRRPQTGSRNRPEGRPRIGLAHPGSRSSCDRVSGAGAPLVRVEGLIGGLSWGSFAVCRERILQLIMRWLVRG